MTAMKMFKRLMRTFVAQATIISLLQTTYVFNLQAADGPRTAANPIADIATIASGAMNLYGQYLGQKQQLVMQQIQSAQNQQLMQSLSPNCRKPDGTLCHALPSKFFPNCQVPATISSMPQNVCSAATPDPNQIAQMITYESIAKSWVNYFDQMTSKVSESQNTFGFECLNKEQNKVKGQITGFINQITTLQGKLNQDKQVFRENNRQLLEELNKNRDELFGESGKNNLAIKTADHSQLIGKSCQSALGKDAVLGASKLGYKGLLDIMIPQNKSAGDYNNNRALIESDIRRDVERIQAEIRNVGVTGWDKTVEPSKLKSINETIVKENAKFNLAAQKIRDELKTSFNYSPPIFDKNFSADFGEFMNGSQDFFKKQYINDCVTGADKGIAIPVDQILASLQQKSTNNAGTARDKYRAALKTILDSDEFIDSKMAKIKELEATYKDITVTYQNDKAQRVTETPYDLYMKILARCEDRFKQDDTFTSSGSKGISQKKKIERGQELLRELKNMHDSFAANLGQAVLDKTLSCNGEAKKAGAQCNEDTFNQNSDNFCMAQANQCANEINACYDHMSKEVKARKDRIEALAAVFNKRTEEMVKGADLLFKQQAQAALNMVTFIQQKFPGSEIEIPGDLFVSMPELKTDTYGVGVANDGNISFLDELPAKLDKLKKIFEDQRAKTDDVIAKYIQDKTEAMNREKEKWQQLAEECKGMINTSSQGLAKQNAENAKKQAEQDAAVGKFCKKYDSIKNNPVAGCGKAKDLSDVSDAIASRITSKAMTLSEEFATACNGFMNESSEASLQAENCSKIKDDTNRELCELRNERKLADAKKRPASSGKPDKSSKPPVRLSAICKDGTTDAEFVKNVYNKLSDKDKEKLKDSDKREKLVKGLADKKADLDELISGAHSEAFFYDLQSLIAKNKDKDLAICKKLEAMDDEEAKDKIADLKKKIADKEKAPASEKAEDKTKREAEVADLKNNLQTLEDGSKNSKRLAELLQELADAGSKVGENDSETSNFQLNRVKRIGEQMDGPCDAQASNNNMPKAFGGGSLLPTGFDQKVLGK